MPNILIGALGDHPAVITSAVKAFAAQKPPIEIDAVHVLYPESREEFIGAKGVEMIRTHLHPRPVEGASLPFADADSAAASVAFLRKVNAILDRWQDEPDTNIYLLLAGGRKNMAALLAFAAPFYPKVKAMYHILDRREGTSADVFHSLALITAGVPHAEENVRASLDQPLGALNLFEVPYPGAFADAALLKDALRSMNAGGERVTLPRPVTETVVMFYAAVQEPNGAQKGLDVWLSQTAADQYAALAADDPALAERALAVMAQMTNGNLLNAQSTRPPGRALFRMFHPSGADVHPAFVTKETHINHYPNGRFDKAVVCALARPAGSDYQPSVQQIHRTLDDKPVLRLAALGPNERTLIVPLGRSPMVAAQTYRLLTESEAEGRPGIPTVALVYPANDGEIKADVRLLKQMFEARYGDAVEVCRYKVEGWGDLDSKAACIDYFKTLRRAVQEMRAAYPHRQIDLSLSGGRKGMSALALFAAQAEGIDKVYHTLITDPKLAERVEKDTGFQALRSVDDAECQARLFLDAYTEDERSKFVLFPVPVIPFTAQETPDW